MLILSLLVALASLQEGRSNEPLLREVFVREFKDKDPVRRLEAVRRLSSQSEEKTILLLSDALRDPEALVRKAVVEAIGSCTDRTGAGIKALTAALLNKKEDRAVRIAVAKALCTVRIKADALEALVQAITSVGDLEKDLQPLVSECTRTLGWVTGKDFGAGKETPEKWKRWLADNKTRIVREDQELLGLATKPPAGKGK